MEPGSDSDRDTNILFKYLDRDTNILCEDSDRDSNILFKN